MYRLVVIKIIACESRTSLLWFVSTLNLNVELNGSATVTDSAMYNIKINHHESLSSVGRYTRNITNVEYQGKQSFLYAAVPNKRFNNS